MESRKSGPTETTNEIETYARTLTIVIARRVRRIPRRRRCCRRSGCQTAGLLDLSLFGTAATASAAQIAARRQTERFRNADVDVGRLVSAGAHRNAEACVQRIVVASVVVGVEELFEPLQKLKVVLKAAAYQFVDRNDLSVRSVDDDGL